MDQTAESSAQLPVELIDIIASDLRRTQSESLPWTGTPDANFGTGDLLACSLVCRQWRAAVLPHLFHSITYSFRPERDEDGDGDSPDLSPAKGSTRYRTLPMFCEFLQSNPAVGPWIRRLKLVYQPSRWSDGLDPGDYPLIYPEDILDPQPFARVLELCPRVDELHLVSVLLRDMDLPTHIIRKPLEYLKLSPYHNFKSVMEDALFGGGNAVAAPLAFFSTVKHLCFSELILPGEVTKTAAFPFPEVDSLEFEGDGDRMTGICDMLERSPIATSIHTLTSDGLRTHTNNRRWLVRLVGIVGPCLDAIICRNIGLRLHDAYIVRYLGVCAQLRSLYFGVHVTARSYHTVGVISFWTKYLSPSAPLECFELVLEFHEDVTEGIFGRFASKFDKVLGPVVRYMRDHSALRATMTLIVGRRGPLHIMPRDDLCLRLGFTGSAEYERLQVHVLYK